MQSRDLVEAHRLVFSVKLYDHQGPIARRGVVPTNPPDRPRYEKCPDRARVKYSPTKLLCTPKSNLWIRQWCHAASNRHHAALSRFHGADRRHLIPTILKAGFTPPIRPRKKTSSSIILFSICVSLDLGNFR